MTDLELEAAAEYYGWDLNEFMVPEESKVPDELSGSIHLEQQIAHYYGWDCDDLDGAGPSGALEQLEVHHPVDLVTSREVNDDLGGGDRTRVLEQPFAM